MANLFKDCQNIVNLYVIVAWACTKLPTKAIRGVFFTRVKDAETNVILTKSFLQLTIVEASIRHRWLGSSSSVGTGG